MNIFLKIKKMFQRFLYGDKQLLSSLACNSTEGEQFEKILAIEQERKQRQDEFEREIKIQREKKERDDKKYYKMTRDLVLGSQYIWMYQGNIEDFTKLDYVIGYFIEEIEENKERIFIFRTKKLIKLKRDDFLKMLWIQEVDKPSIAEITKIIQRQQHIYDTKKADIKREQWSIYLDKLLKINYDDKAIKFGKIIDVKKDGILFNKYIDDMLPHSLIDTPEKITVVARKERYKRDLKKGHTYLIKYEFENQLKLIKYHSIIGETNDDLNIIIYNDVETGEFKELENFLVLFGKIILHMSRN